jgi:hypothetical protein
MLAAGLGIPGRGEAWPGVVTLAGAPGPALGVLSFATRSGRGGTTGRAAGWPASARDNGAAGAANAAEAGARGTATGRCAAEEALAAPEPTGLPVGNGWRGPERIWPGFGAVAAGPGNGFAEGTGRPGAMIDAGAACAGCGADGADGVGRGPPPTGG